MKGQTIFYTVLLTLLKISFANVIVESLPAVPHGWARVRDADPNRRLRLRVALEQPHLEHFERVLYNVSTPGHPRYGSHLTRDEVSRLVAPSPESVNVVTDWLRHQGVPADEIEEKGEWVNFRTTVAHAQFLLDAEFAVYLQENTGREALRTLNYSVPEGVRDHVTMIQPTTRFGQSQAQKSSIHHVNSKGELSEAVGRIQPEATLKGEGNVGAACDKHPSPHCLRALYNVGNFTGSPDVNTTLAVGGFLKQWAKYDCLENFLDKFAPYANGQNFTAIPINGGKNDQDDMSVDDTEANLDIQYAAAMGFQSELQYISVGGRGPLVPDANEPGPESTNEPYLEYLDYLLGLDDEKLPHVLSTSYGEDEQSVPAEFAMKVCNQFGQLGARGVSVIFSSGDSGPGQNCVTNDGKNTTRFIPNFPGACPFVTSVGSTTLTTFTEAMFPSAPSIPHPADQEEAVSFSSGGFSELFPRPAYQDAAVLAYLDSAEAKSDDFAGRYFNTQGRGFPDVAAQGVGFPVIMRGDEGQGRGYHVREVSGTSASAPTIGGIVALLINGAGGKRLGFLNPLLYSSSSSDDAQLFNDIVHGRSSGCSGSSGGSAAVPGAGFNATAGWDPVTGLGTPRFDALLAAVKKGTEGKGAATDDDE